MLKTVLLAALGCAALGCLPLLACGVAERSQAADSGVEPAFDVGKTGDGGIEADAEVGGEGSCTPWRMEAKAYAGVGSASEIFAIVELVDENPGSQLIEIDPNTGNRSDLQVLRYGAPDNHVLHLDEGHLYFTDTESDGADVVRIDPTNASANGVIAQQQVHPSMAAGNAAFVYWGVDGGIMRQGKNNNLAQRVYDFQPYNERVTWLGATDAELLYSANSVTYRVQLTSGSPEDARMLLVETGSPIGIFSGRFYYFVPDTESGSGNDEIMSMPVAGGAARLEASEERIDAPTLTDAGDLLWFSFLDGGYIIVEQRATGLQDIRTLSGANGGTIRWIVRSDSRLAWIVGTTLSVLSDGDCQ